jgi:hypothetical protein
MSLHTNKKAEPVKTGTVLKEAAEPKPKSKKAQSAQGTAFLRRRKVAKVLAERAKGQVQTTGSADDLTVDQENQNQPQLMKFPDYPILDMSDEFQGQMTPQQHHARRLLTPHEDPNLVNEFWAIQGAVIGASMDRLPIITDHSEVHSMDLMY